MIKTNLAKNIVKFRKGKGWTQNDLAIKSKVTYPSIVKLEQELMINPTLKTLLKLIGVFEVTLDELIRQ